MTEDNFTVVTDYKWKEFKMTDEVPKKVLKDYDYLNECDLSYGWIKYRRTWYHISDFLSCYNEVYSPNCSFLKLGYDGYLIDSYFSGVLIKFENDMYQIATYYS